jgi:tetrahydromethanopterin S-methyltransferase subunit G
MKEKLAAIDVSSIEELQRIKAEQDVILQRLDLMEERRELVSEEVFKRVHRDYEGRMKSLEEEAVPLKVQAKEQYSELKKLLAEIEVSVRNAEMDREEMQLRHDLGEFSDEAFAEHMEEHETRVAEHQGNLEEAQSLRERFVSAFHSEGELEEEMPSSPPPPSPELELDTLGGVEIPGASDLLGDEPPPIPNGDEVISMEGDGSPDVESADEGVPVATEAEEIPGQTASIPMPSPEADAGATMILRWPKLVRQTEDGDLEEHAVVGGSTTLGSGLSCDIVISGIKVADRHAEIALTSQGHVIRDLKSSVGTLINGVEITEWNLSDGDSIQLGEVVLIFREG